MEKIFSKYTFLVLAIAFGLMMAGSSLTQATSATVKKPAVEKGV